jgi:SAM-dependent methyltransferase
MSCAGSTGPRRLRDDAEANLPQTAAAASFCANRSVELSEPCHEALSPTHKKETPLTNAFVEHYRDFYNNSNKAELHRWREIGAIGKAQNIVDLWRRVGSVPVSRVIDIGSGDGAVAAELAERGFFERLDGFDVSPSGTSVSSGRGVPGATFRYFAGEHLPADDSSYDLAILSHVLEHVEEPRALLREAARVAQWVFVEVPLELTIRKRGDFAWTDTGHINFYNPLLIRQLVQSIGLQVVCETVVCPNSAMYEMHGGNVAYAKWKLKEALLRIAQPVAVNLDTYHGALIAKSSAER